ncbi:MAG: NapC/NirT family cytochrome c [Phycisphaerae bacterium]|nr:NapC/NirT family cytochrome c [Phycisphaerae bacterium]
MQSAGSDKKSKRRRRFKGFCLFVLGIVFAIGAFLGINFGMAQVSSPEYCGSSCHEMQTAYQTWELSPHGTNHLGVRVECADCHLPSKDNYFHYTFAKAWTGAKDLAVHYFGPEYDVEATRKKVQAKFTNEPCLRCHQDLLVSPTGFDAMAAHQGLIDRPDAPENQCIHCHPGAGHERDSKLHR